MKKNISINISGIIFHIEEDGYEHLKKYLESINQYFTTFDDNDEIVADIEGRIAEIFLSKLNEGKQVITKEDVESLMTTMGSVRDFQSIEEPEEPMYRKSDHSENTSSQKTDDKQKLYRDSNRKILGGVCAGLANYFGIDPLWMRLAFVVLTASTGVFAIAYIIFWIVVPVSDQLKEDTSIKKMYRNPENRVIGGVAGGVAAYFGIDAAYVRLFWVLSIFFFGTGVLLYIILWLILPEAKSITEKVQMKGDPVTLSNIESNIKKELNVDENKEESVFVKIILFPFRLIAMIIKGLGNIFGSLFKVLFEIIRISFGLIITFCGICGLFSVILSAGVLLGLFASSGVIGFEHLQHELPFLFVQEGFTKLSVISAFFASGIPMFLLIVLGVSIIAKTKIFSPSVGWSLLGVWIISLVGLSFSVPTIVIHFSERGYYKETEHYDLNGKVAVLTLYETGMFENYNGTRLRIRGHEDSEYKLVKEYESRGRSRKEANENAKNVSYNVELKSDSIFVFDSSIGFYDEAKFRGQELDMTLYVPYNQPFKMGYDMSEIIYNTINRGGYHVSDMDIENTWVITPSGLKCTTCEKSISSYDEDSRENNLYSTSRMYEFQDFNKLEIGSAFEVHIAQGEEYKVVLYGEEETIDQIRLMKESDLLDIRYGKIIENETKRNKVKVKITMPNINELKATGVSNVYINDFKGERLLLSLAGASSSEVKGDFEELSVQLDGASELEISGTGSNLSAELSGKTKLEANNYMVRVAKIEAKGASKCKLYVTEQIEVESSGVSDVRYRGDAVLISEDVLGE